MGGFSVACAGVEEESGETSAAATVVVPPAPFCGADTRERVESGPVRTQLGALPEPSRTDPGFRPIRLEFWSADDVQREIARVARSEAFACTPHAAYPVTYARMTAARDRRRCALGDAMAPPTKLDARLNDALSDLMTRNYLELVEFCVANPGKSASPSADLGGLLCSQHGRAAREDWDAVRMTAATTGIYLSTNLTLALSTLPHVDALWNGTPYRTIEQRVERLRAYKPTFDAFNAFLAHSVDTVVDALGDAGFLRGSLVNLGVFPLDGSPFTRLAMGRLRDDGFESALRIAMLTPKGTHPWTAVGPDGRMHMASQVVAAPPFRGGEALGDELASLERRTRTVQSYLASSAFGFLGAHRFSSLAENRSTCLAKLAAPR